jgi:hypothetical protein
MTDATYFAVSGLVPARRLQRAGQWDAALAVLPQSGSRALLLRADILTDRHAWRVDQPDEALAAVAAIRDPYPEAAEFMTAQLEYWRRLMRPDAPQIAGDPTATFADLADDERFGGWTRFWYAVSLELLHQDTAGAGARYKEALTAATARGDLLLESYAVRHLGSHAWEAGDTGQGIALFERSYDLRAACGARPHTAAAAAALAGVLGEGERSTRLLSLVAATAAELNLTWLKKN